MDKKNFYRQYKETLLRMSEQEIYKDYFIENKGGGLL